MADRARMFKKKMVVSIDKLVVEGDRVSFVQKFAQGTYKDAGTKELVLAQQGQELVITHEELLTSKIGVNPGPLMFATVGRWSDGEETDYRYISGMCTDMTSQIPSDDVVLHAQLLDAAPPGTHVELTLLACSPVDVPDDNGIVWSECSCDADKLKKQRSAKLVPKPATGDVRARWNIGTLPCAVVAQARAWVGDQLVGEIRAYGDGGSCAE